MRVISIHRNSFGWFSSLIDIRHDPSENDKHMYRWIVEQGFNPVIIATKADKLKRSQLPKHLKQHPGGTECYRRDTDDSFSSLSKQGRDEIWELIEQYALNFEI